MNPLIYLSALSAALPLVIALLRYRKLVAYQRWLIPLFVVALSTEYASMFLFDGKGTNLPMVHIYAVLEFGIMLEVFRTYFKALPINRLARLLFIAFVAFAVFEAYFLERIGFFNSYSRGIESIVLIAFSLYFYLNLLQKLQVEQVHRFPMFWIATGVLIYFAGNLFLFAAANELLLNVSDELNVELYKIHNFLNILKNLLFAYGLWLSHRT
jgi:hypothetical protein